MKYNILHGDCRELMATLDENSVDAIVTDPPYELGFMGKSWDASGVAFDVNTWQQALRVLKPGGHLIAFSGSRTYHRMAVAIEDAGFEIRDQIMWVYGSGFPKSHNISKGIDKAAGKIGLSVQNIKLELKEAYKKSKLTLFDINKKCGFEASGYFRTSSSWAYVLPDFDKWIIIKSVLGMSSDLDDVFIAAQREIIGFQKRGNAVNTNFMSGGNDITAPATPAAKQWQGWGTALKPAHEPMVLARKPVIGTVANNVLTYGVGGLNIDGSRVGSGGGTKLSVEENDKDLFAPGTGKLQRGYGEVVEGLGRWPANFIHDGSDEVVALFPSVKGATSRTDSSQEASENAMFGGGFAGQVYDDGFNTSAARFFYCAKASKRDRNEGLDKFEAKEIGGKGNGLARACATCSASVIDGCACPDRTFINPSRLNHHPTVKPTSLMQYLVRLVTPPGGTVLDPFLGSGSTGKACAYEGFDFIGMEVTGEYIPIATARIDFALADKDQQLDL